MSGRRIMQSQPQSDLFRYTDHRQWPRPETPWVLRMTWHDLLFLHGPVPEESLRPLIPDPLEIDTRRGSAWIGVIPFTMTDVAPRWVPSIPDLSSTPEINVRTYVTDGTICAVGMNRIMTGENGKKPFITPLRL